MMTSSWPVSCLHHVIAVSLVQRVRLERLLDVVVPLDGGDVVHIADAEQLLDLIEAFLGERRGAMLLVHRVIAGGVLFARLLAFDLLAAHQLAG